MSEPTAKTVVRELGGFSLLREIGEGGMGKVFLARQKSLDRKVALKVLLPELAKDEEFRTRFLREAKAAALFSHSHIVSVVDAGVDESFGVHYIAFEFVEGGSLEDLLQEQPRLEEDRALDLSRGVLAGLAFAESKGIIHRDVKPDNVLVTPSGSPKLADLGLAKSPESMESQVTQTGVVLGTPLYMAPEQALGEDVLDIRTDLYAWGLCLWRMLTGLMPFNEEGGCSSLQILTKHINEDLVDVRERNPAVSDDVAEFLSGLTARDRDDRYPSAASALADLDRLLAGEALAGTRDSAGAPAAPRPSSRISRSARLAKSSGDTQVAAGRGALGGVSPGLLAGILIGALGVGFGLALGTRGEEAPTPAASPEVALATPTPEALPTPTPALSETPAVAETPVEAPVETPVEAPVETPAEPEEPSLESVAQAASKLGDEHPKLLRRAFGGQFPQILRWLQDYREAVVPEARSFVDTLSKAFTTLQAYAAATDRETREIKARELLAIQSGQGPIAVPLRIVLLRLQRFVHLTKSLRAFAFDLGPDRILSFQRQLMDSQSKAVLADYATLAQEDGQLGENAAKATRLVQEIVADPGSEVGHVGQAWSLMCLIERINTWRESWAKARVEAGFKGTPKELLGGGLRGENRRLLKRILEQERRLVYLIRAWAPIQAGRKHPSLLHQALRDVWGPAIQVFSLLVERADDSLSAVLLQLHDEHMWGHFVERRLQRVAAEDELSPDQALGLVATGDLGAGELQVWFMKVQRKLRLRRGAGNLGSVSVKVPLGGILRTALEPTADALWVSQDREGEAYAWEGVTWAPGTKFKFQSVPKGGKAFWTLTGENPQGSFEQEVACERELAGRARKSPPGAEPRRPAWPDRGKRKNRKALQAVTRQERMEARRTLSAEQLEEFQRLTHWEKRRYLDELILKRRGGQ